MKLREGTRFQRQRPNLSKLIVLAVLAPLFAILACSKDDSTPAAQLSTEATATAQPTATATPQEASSEPAKDEQPSEPAAQLSAEATATAQPTATATPQEASSEPVKDEQPSDVQGLTPLNGGQRVTVTFRAISSGEHHTCGLREDGSQCAGATFGQGRRRVGYSRPSAVEGCTLGGCGRTAQRCAGALSD